MDARSLKFPHGLAQVSSKMASVRRVACNSTPAARLNVPTARQARGTVVLVSIGFLRQFATTLAPGPGPQFDACRASTDRMVLLTFTAWLTRRFRFALDRHNFATDFRPSSAETRHRSTADANHARKGGGNGGTAEGEIAGRCLPSSWANAGAFSLLTPASKLAQY